MRTLKLSLMAFFAFLGSQAVAQNTEWTLEDLTLETRFEKYICHLFNANAIKPEGGLSEHNVQFDRFVGSRGLSKFLLTAHFQAGEHTCRYNLRLARNEMRGSVDAVESQAFSESPEARCEAGREYIDSLFKSSAYFLSNPYLSFRVPHVQAEELCGANAPGIEVTFIKE